MGATSQFTDASGKISLSEVDVHSGWVGKPLRLLEEATGARVAYLTRYGDGLLPDANTVLQESDIVHLLLRADEQSAVERVVTAAPEVQA
jgi:trk system potassium uptake protein TrkA